VLDPDLRRGKSLAEDIANSGYQVQQVLSQKSLDEQIVANPPHIFVIPYADTVLGRSFEKARDLVHQLVSRLPEVHVIVLAKEEELDEACALYDHGAYDVLEHPIYPLRQLLQSLDRAATTDYYIYLNEQLKSDSQQTSSQSSPLDMFEIYSETMSKLETEADAVKLTLQEVSRCLGGAQVVFFRYIRSRSTMVAETCLGIERETIANVGVEFKKTEPRFHEKLLSRPDRLVGVVDLVRNGFLQRQFLAYTIQVSGAPEGMLLALLGERDSTQYQNDPSVRLTVRELGQKLTELSLRQRIAKSSIIDEESESLHREFLLRKLKEEVTRARRINRSASLLILQVDQIKDLGLRLEPVTVERIHKALVSVFLKNSRLTDLVGRLANDQYGIILPHTSRKGAAIKAERLRRIIESADFSEAAAEPLRLTISVGVSEYPGVCNDASGLLRTADEALVEIIKTGVNRVCVASPQAQFVPDFQPEDATR